MRIDLHRARSAWSRIGGRYVSGESFIEPFDNPALTVTSEPSGTLARFMVTETRPGGDSVTVTVEPGAVRVEAGVLGVAPLYLATDSGIVYAAWDAAELSRFAHPDAIVDRVVARLLTRRQRYSRETLFAGIHRLTAGATAAFTASGYSYTYPAPAEHVLHARRLRPDADPVAVFTTALDSQVRPILTEHPGAVAVELSGGLDSANVAVSASHHAAHDLMSVGLLVDGPAGLQQRARRDVLTSMLTLNDIAVRARDHLPFAAEGPRTVREPHYADGDVYREAFDAARRAAAHAGARVVLTGFGGDEMLALRAVERRHPVTPPDLPRWLAPRTLEALDELDTAIAPASAVAVPCLLAFSARHPAYLNAGLWPVAPLADPDLLRLGESLPVPLRAGKALFRDRLTRAGLPSTVTHPRLPESFTDTMQTALRRNGIPILTGMLDRSILTEHGYVDRAALCALLRNAQEDAPLPDLLYDTLALEVGLRSMTETGNTAPGVPDIEATDG